MKMGHAASFLGGLGVGVWFFIAAPDPAPSPPGRSELELDPQAWIDWAEAEEAREPTSDRAARAYQIARALGDPSGRAGLRLGFLRYAQGQDQEAEALLRQAQARGLEPALVAFTLAAIQARKEAESPSDAHGANPTWPLPEPVPQAPDLALRRSMAPPDPPSHESGSMDAGAGWEAPSVCSVPLLPVGGGLGVEVQVEGVRTVLLYDTGASSTLLTQELANAVGAAPDWEVVFRATTANGRIELPTAVFHQLQLGDRSSEIGRVAVCGRCLEGLQGVGGLFGLDLQERLGVELDLRGRRLEFRDCPP